MAWSTSLLIWIWGMYQISRSAWHGNKSHAVRSHRPRVDTLQQFPAIPVGLPVPSFPIRALAYVNVQSSLASRGATFQDATYATVYRNVSTRNSF
jgi:hypothetical protein